MAKQLNILDFSMSANGSFQLPVEGSYFRILTATGKVAVIGDTFGKLGPINSGQGLENTPFRRLTIQDTSGLANSGTILVSEENFIDQTLYGSITLGAAVAIDSASQLGIKRPEISTGTYSVFGAITVNTPETVFTAAANTNGAILLSAQVGDSNAVGDSKITMLAKATAPANINDGEVMVRAFQHAQGASLSCYYGQLQGPQHIAAGKGLFVISNQTVTLADRTARYKLL